MKIEMHFLPEPGNSGPNIYPNVLLREDQAGLIPLVGDTIEANHISSKVVERRFSFTPEAVLVTIVWG